MPPPRIQFRVLARGDRWHVWRHGSDFVEFVGADWYAMHDYIEERIAIEGPAETIVQGFGVLPSEAAASPPCDREGEGRSIA